MRVTMVKKRLESGEACRKCQQAEDLLRTRGLWDRIDDVVWAVESDPDSLGMRLGREHGVETAPFFIIEGDGEPRVHRQVLRLIKELTPAAASKAPARLSAEEVPAKREELEEKHPSEILRFGLERFGTDCAIAFSGAEDVVLLHMAAKSGLPFSAFCLDTGRLHAETYRFIEKVRAHYGIEIRLMAPDTAKLEPFVRKKGLFSFYEDGHEECCAIRKVEPLRRVLSEHRAWVTGQRRDQSPTTRSGIAVLEVDPTFSGREGDLFKLNPLAAWSSADVWDYIRENDVPYNPLHEKGFVSIGCEPCTRAILPGEHERAGRWWWEESTKRECGLHIGNTDPPPKPE